MCSTRCLEGRTHLSSRIQKDAAAFTNYLGVYTLCFYMALMTGSVRGSKGSRQIKQRKFKQCRIGE